MRNRRFLTTTATAALVLGVVLAPPALAQTGGETERADDGMIQRAQTLPPSCVVAENEPATFTSRGTVTVTNTCTRIERVKVVIAFGGDSECFVRQAGGVAVHRYTFPSRFDGLVRC